MTSNLASSSVPPGPYVYAVVKQSDYDSFRQTNDALFRTIIGANSDQFHRLPEYDKPILAVDTILHVDDLQAAADAIEHCVIISIDAKKVWDRITWDGKRGSLADQLRPSEYWPRSAEPNSEVAAARGTYPKHLGDLSEQAYIYKILTDKEFESFREDRVSRGSPLDFLPKDNPPYMHVSAKNAVYPALGRFYEGRNVVAVAIPFDKVKFEVRWKWAAKSAYFPHMLRPLTLDDMATSYTIKWNKETSQHENVFH